MPSLEYLPIARAIVPLRDNAQTRKLRVLSFQIRSEIIGTAICNSRRWARELLSDALCSGLDIETAMREVEALAERRLIASGLGFCEIVELARRSTGTEVIDF